MTTPRTMLLVNFDEPVDEALPVDAMGQLEPLSAIDPDDALITMPAVEEALTGVGRYFNEAGLTAIAAVDAADGDTLSQRDVTIRAIAQILEGTSVTRRVLIARGDSSSAAERIAYGLEIYWLLPSPSILELRFFWQTAAGVVKTQVGGTFEYTMPESADRASSGFLYLAATRRWVSSTEVICRYYVNGKQIAEVTSVDGDIGGGTTGHTSIGAVKHLDSAGTFSRFWEGIIDEIQVDNYEVSPEEIAEEWDRITTHQPNGEKMLAALVPPGSNWADRGTYWRKALRVAGQAVGLGLAKIEEWRNTWLPDRAYLAKLAEWEVLHGIAPGGADSLDTRRDRVERYMQRESGYTIEKLMDVLAEPLDLAAADVEILTFSNRIDDAFATLEAERWFVDTASGQATWSIIANQLRVVVGGGSFIRWSAAGFERACVVLSLTSDGQGPTSGVGRLYIGAKLATYAVGSMATDCITGIAAYNARTKALLVFGVYDDAGTAKLGYYYFDGSAAAAIVSIENPAPATPVWLRMFVSEYTGLTPKAWTFGWSTTGPDSGFTDTVVNDIMSAPEWAGFWTTCQVATDEVTSVEFDDAIVIDPGGHRPFAWYAFRDPGLPGNPNLVLATAMIKSGLRPAHTHGAAIDSLSLLCDTEGHGCDLGPMGGL